MRLSFRAVGPELILGCIKGNRNSQKKLYSLLSPIIYTKLLEELNSKKESEIILQKIFVKVFTSIESYDRQILFEDWFMTIYNAVVLTTLNHKRS